MRVVQTITITACLLAAPSLPAEAADSVAASATEAGLTEQAVFDLWLKSSREVASWRTSVGAARFDVVAARVFPNPTLQLAGSLTTSGPPPDGRVNWGPQLSFPLPILGQLGGRREAALAALRVAEVSVAVNIWSRAVDIQQAMRDRAFADARVSTVQRNLSELARIEQIVAARAESGANSQYDVLRVSVTAGTLKAALAEALVDRASAESKLVGLVNAEGVNSMPFTRGGLAAFRGPEDEASLLAHALERRPDLELARRGVRAAELSASRYRKEAIPVPSVYVGAYFTREQTSTTLQGGLSFPLPVFDRNQGQVGRAVAEAEGQRTMALSLTDRVKAEVHGAWQARADSRRALEEFRAGALASVNTLIERAEVSYRAGGSFMIMDLLDAHRAGWDARQQELDLERAFADAEAELERAAALIGVELPKD